jgi:hypothetical protein
MYCRFAHTQSGPYALLSMLLSLTRTRSLLSHAHYCHTLTVVKRSLLSHAHYCLQEPDHYEGIVAMMRLREQLREYVSQANAVHAATGLPILRPMFIQYPLDPECQTAQVRSYVT